MGKGWEHRRSGDLWTQQLIRTGREMAGIPQDPQHPHTGLLRNLSCSYESFKLLTSGTLGKNIWKQEECSKTPRSQPWRCCKFFARITFWNESRNGIQRQTGCQKQNAFASIFSKGKQLLHFWKDLTRIWGTCKQTGGKKGRELKDSPLGPSPSSGNQTVSG